MFYIAWELFCCKTPIRLIKIIANFSGTFLVSSPGSIIGMFGAVAFARSVMISSAAYVRKESYFTAGRWNCFGKNLQYQHSIILL